MARKASLRSIVETIDRQTKLTSEVVARMNGRAEKTLAKTERIATELEDRTVSDVPFDDDDDTRKPPNDRNWDERRYPHPDGYEQMKGEIVKEVMNEIIPLLEVLENLIQEQKALKSADPMVNNMRDNLLGRIEARRGAMTRPRN